MSANIGRLLYCLPGVQSITPRQVLPRTPTFLWSQSPVLILGTVRNYAARKGTRTRKEKQKQTNKAAKKEKEELAAHLKTQMMSKMKHVQLKPLFPDDSKKSPSVDNVYFSGLCPWPIYDVLTAINNFKEVHHPTMYDNPKAVVKAYFEFDLSTKKKTQFVENVSGVVDLPHKFDTGRPIKTICLFCKDKKLNDEALKAGADVAVGLEGLKMFQEGELDSEDYDIILSHPDVLPELAPIRGLISKKFPNMKKGTVAFDVVSLVKRYKNGVDFIMTPSALVRSVGFMQVPIGIIDMPPAEIEKNWAAVVKAVLNHKPPNALNSFLKLGGITSEFSKERFKVSLDHYFDDEESNSNEGNAIKTPTKEVASS